MEEAPGGSKQGAIDMQAAAKGCDVYFACFLYLAVITLCASVIVLVCALIH